MSDEQNNSVAGHNEAARAQPSGPKGDTPATAGKGETKVSSDVSEKTEGRLNPSSPGNTGTTPGTVNRIG